MKNSQLHAAPEVSVIIPVQNNAKDIVETVDCVLSQSYSASEVIVVDMGSTDGSAALIEEQRGECICLVHQMSTDLSSARNLGASVAKYEVLVFLGVGDQWEPHFLEEIIKLYHEFPEARCYSTAYQLTEGDDTFIDPNLPLLKRVKSKALLDNYFDSCSQGASPLMISSFCIRKSELPNVGLFPKNEAVGADQDFLARAALKSTIAYSPSVLAFYDSEPKGCLDQKVIPVTECTFSKNIYHWANEEGRPMGLKESMLNYTASHLLRLVDLNVSLGRINAARNILSDSRCKRQPLRYFWSAVKCWFLKHMASRQESIVT